MANLVSSILKCCAFLVLGVVFFLSSCSDEETNFVNNWDEDVYFFSKNLKEKHVELFFNISESEFDTDITNLRNGTATNSAQQTTIGLLKTLSKIGDSHTQLRYSNILSSLPISIKSLDDGFFLTGVDIDNEQFLGSKILGVNDTPIEEIIEKFRAVISYENESNFKNQVVDYMRYIDFYFDFEFIDSSDPLIFNLANEQNYAVKTDEKDIVEVIHENPPLFLKNTETIYWHEVLEEDNILYIQYNACKERNDLSFQSFTDQIVSDIENNDDITKLVIDLRHNGGGNSGIMSPLITAMEKFLEDDRLAKENMYLIIGRRTFSSAVLNTLELQDKLDLVVLGEPTGGKPNHHGEVKNFRLPNSFLNVSYSTKYFQLSDNEEDSINPDIVIEYSSDHFFNGHDPVLEEIKKD